MNATSPSVCYTYYNSVSPFVRILTNENKNYYRIYLNEQGERCINNKILYS